MTRVLSPSERRLLEGVVAEARDVVEAACAQRVSALGVAEERVPSVLGESDRRLRRGLRARARQLGSVEALTTEAGFEHWHRMLFARFLADNGLLVDDMAGQPVSVEELAEVAAELGEPDRWEVAARFAAAMLPGIFRVDDPVLQMRLPVETRQRLEDLLGTLPAEVLRADDALGWVYQYWQARRKDEVNRSERKIGGADLAPVTQLFTEDYMVRFLLENSLGAWWAARHPDSPLLAGWTYLRFTEDRAPAAGSFEEWPTQAAEVTVMDPCCGSGHFLVASFGMLWRMRVEEEGLSVAEAQDAVLRDNLFGLELDPRCTQIAAFALALEAWKTGGYRRLPVPQVACSGIAARAPLSEWTMLSDGDVRVESALARLHGLFVSADTLGSLIDPVRAAEDAGLESVDWHVVAPLVQQALSSEAGKHGDDPAAAVVFGEAAAGIARAADYLSRRYTLIATNPPYLGRSKQSQTLMAHVDLVDRDARADLALVMMTRAVSLAKGAGALAFVTPQNWLQLARSNDLRRRLLRECRFVGCAWLGSGGFAGISGEVVTTALVLIAADKPRDDSLMMVIDCQSSLGAHEKSKALKEYPFAMVPQRQQANNPDARVLPRALMATTMGDLSDSHQGIKTSDNPRFVRYFWEGNTVSNGWRRMQSAPEFTSSYGGRSEICYWEDGFGRMTEVCQEGAPFRGRAAWGRKGVVVREMGNMPATLYTGELFDGTGSVVTPTRAADLAALWAFCRSKELNVAVRSIDTSLKVSSGTLNSVPMDLDYWRSVAEREFPEGLPEPFSSDATQWLFKGRPVGSEQPLQVGVARLLGFRWPDQEPDALDLLADRDGVVCLPAVGGESPAADRLLELLATAYEDEWSSGVLDGLLAGVGAKPGKTGLEAWLRNGFFTDHCKVFGNRPFIWQIWDRDPGGFSALVNYHRLDRALLERITYDYLGSWWMGRMRDEVGQDLPGAARRLAMAETLQAKLAKILEGEPPYDIFVRWKSLAEQPVGWDPDLDDGVRMNIRPFVTSDVLRSKPNIKWAKDRGKNPDGSERLNDLHFTIAEKQVARGGST